MKPRAGDRVPNVLSIAGSDPSGGAGVQADLKTFAALGCYGMAAVTALTAQNTRGVFAIHLPPADFVAAEVDAVLDDIEVQVIKIGMLGSGDIARAVARCLRRRPATFIVVDPVLAATSGDSLAKPDLIAAILGDVLPLASLITPNLDEAAKLADAALPGDADGMRRIAEKLHALGARSVLVKGGHLTGADAIDVLFDGTSHRSFSETRISTGVETHGTGCTLASAIAAFAAHGATLDEAIAAAKSYVSEALKNRGRLRAGHGAAPLDHLYAFRENADGGHKITK